MSPYVHTKMKPSFYTLTRVSIGVCLLLTLSCQPSSRNLSDLNISRAEKDPDPYHIVTKRTPSLLNFDELTTLLKKHGQDTQASKKAEKLFSSPFIDNTHFKKHGIPKINNYEGLGPSLRVSTWNIEKSINIANAAEAISCENVFKDNLSSKTLSDQYSHDEAIRQRAALAASDVLLCQEMDIGHCRSDYLFAAKHLARKMGMNFVYAPQQLEIDPVYLDADDVTFDNQNLADHQCDNHDGQLKDYKGVFGVAVMSRYPIKRVQVFPLKNQPYDWYTGEIKKPDFLEKLRRYGTEKIFRFRAVREVKTGGRGFTRVDLHVPGIPHETLTVINIHLEIKTPPKQRLVQLEEILSYMSDIKNPVVMAGDFNNASRDISATSITRASTRTASDPQNIFTTALHLADAAVITRLRTVINGVKNFKNPLAVHVPVVLPNKKKPLFNLVENYRFNDGGAFDFRGDKERSVYGYTGTLSNSNQRTRLKRFTFSFSTPRAIGPVGHDRLDWIFVKSFLTHPKDKKGPYQLAPHFGETFSLMNLAVKKRYSDHHPISILLPIKEPK